MKPNYYIGGATATPSDTVKAARGGTAFVCAVGGTVSALTEDGSTVALTVTAGITYNIGLQRVNATGTTATGITLLW